MTNCPKCGKLVGSLTMGTILPLCQCQWRHDANTFYVQDQSAEIEALRRERDTFKAPYLEQVELHNKTLDELRDMEQERNRLKDTVWYLNGIKDDRLAASQAREQQLREVLEEVRQASELSLKEISDYMRETKTNSMIASKGTTDSFIAFDKVKAALALPQDTTALNAWGAKLLRKVADKLTIAAHPSLQLLHEADELEAKK